MGSRDRGPGDRTAQLDDVPDLLELFHVYDRRFFGEPLMDADDLHSDLAMPSLDLAADTLGLRTPDGTLVAGVFVTPVATWRPSSPRAGS